MAHTMREARRKLSDLVKEALRSKEDVRIGRRGNPEVTLIATSELARLRLEYDEMRSILAARVGTSVASRSIEGSAVPYAGLSGALLAGHFRTQSGPGPRRRIPNLRSETGLSLEAQARIGEAATREPPFRRPPTHATPEADS